VRSSVLILLALGSLSIDWLEKVRTVGAACEKVGFVSINATVLEIYSQTDIYIFVPT
jgi:hypothetical protein